MTNIHVNSSSSKKINRSYGQTDVLNVFECLRHWLSRYLCVYDCLEGDCELKQEKLYRLKI